MSIGEAAGIVRPTSRFRESDGLACHPVELFQRRGGARVAGGCAETAPASGPIWIWM